MAMTQPFIEGFGGMGASSTYATVISRLSLRGIYATGAIQTATMADGRVALRNGQNSLVNFVQGITEAFACGARLYNSSGTNTALGFVIYNSSSRYYAVRLVGTDLYLRSSVTGGSTILVEGMYADGVYVELVANGSVLELYVNNSTTPIASQPFDIADAPFRVGCIGATGWNTNYLTDIYVWNTRLGEGTARLLPTTLSVTGGSAGGDAVSVADGLASIDDQTKYVTFEPTQKAQLSVDDIVDDPNAIKAVSILATGRKNGTALLPELVTATTTSESTIATPVLGVGFSGSRTGLTTDPHDSTPWTKAKINSLLVGVGSV